VRQAKTEDASAIRDLICAAYAKWVPLIGREPKPMTVNYEEAVRIHRFDLLYTSGTLVGLVETVPEDGCLLIVNVAVSPPFQGRGLGRKLIAYAESYAAALGFVKIRLYTHKRFTANLQLYGKLGYVVDREEEFMGGIAVYMSKSI
jgi:GNAT superfamily N-acetyltransferase